MKNFLRRRTEQRSEPNPTLEARTLGGLTDFRQKMFEDPDFKDVFVDTIMDAMTKTEGGLFKESNDHPDAYGDGPDSTLSTELHIMRGEAMRHLFAMLIQLGEADEDDVHEKAIKALNTARYAIGELSREVYHQAQLEPPLQLCDEHSLGVYYEGIGQVVVWERVRGLEDEIDGFSRFMRTPEEPPHDGSV